MLLDHIPTRRGTVRDVTRKFEFETTLDLTDSEVDIVLAGGQLRHLKALLAAQAAGAGEGIARDERE